MLRLCTVPLHFSLAPSVAAVLEERRNTDPHASSLRRNSNPSRQTHSPDLEPSYSASYRKDGDSGAVLEEAQGDRDRVRKLVCLTKCFFLRVMLTIQGDRP
jgi:hypothetical protein